MIEEDRFSGALANDPFYIKDLKHGDAIEFDARHIIQTNTDDPVPDPTAPYLPRCLVTNRILKDGAPVRYLYREQPIQADDSGWRITAGDETDEYMEDIENSTCVSLGAVLSVDDSFRDLLGSAAPCAYEWNESTGRFEEIDAPDVAAGLTH